MGRRYCAILKQVTDEIIIRTDPAYHGANKTIPAQQVIVASPTDTHFQIAWDLIGQFPIRSILCEKPVCKNSFQIQSLKERADYYGVDIRMVSNWTFAINRALQRVGEVAIRGEMEIEYNYYHSGNDGFFWDVIQPIYLAGRFKYNRNAPIFDCKVNGNPVTLDDFSHSYPMMISEWLYGDKKRLFSLEDAMKANEKVESAMRGEPDPVVGQIQFTGSMA